MALLGLLCTTPLLTPMPWPAKVGAILVLATVMAALMEW